VVGPFRQLSFTLESQMDDRLTIPFARPKIVRLIGIIQIIFAANFIAIVLFHAHLELKNYDYVIKSNEYIEKNGIEKDYLAYRKSVILEISLPVSIGIITIIVATAFLKGYQWGRIILTIFMFTGMIGGFIGVITGEDLVLSGFEFIIQGIIFFLLIFSSKVKSYFKTAKYIRLENK